MSLVRIAVVVGIVFIRVTLSNNIIDKGRVLELYLISEGRVGSCQFININLLSLERDK
jgi:hypothetical protein